MRVFIRTDYTQMSRTAASFLVDSINKFQQTSPSRKMNIALSSGWSVKVVYNELAEAVERGDVSLANVNIFHGTPASSAPKPSAAHALQRSNTASSGRVRGPARRRPPLPAERHVRHAVLAAWR